MWFVMEKAQSSYYRYQRLLALLRQNKRCPSTLSDVEELLKAGLDANHMHGQYLALHVACVSNFVEALHLLVQYGAQVNAKDGFGRTALHYASERSAVCLDALLQYGADWALLDNGGHTPLHWAAYVNNYDCVRRLLEHAADPNAKNWNLESPLGFAALRGSLESIMILLEYNAESRTENANGVSPLYRLIRTIAIGIGSTRDYQCLQLITRALGWIEPLGELEDELTNDSMPAAVGGGPCDPEIVSLLLPLTISPRSLHALCRYEIRHSIGPSHLPSNLRRLPLPPRLYQYLLLEY